MKSEEGKQIALELAEKADIVVENFSAGAIGRLGLGYEEISRLSHDIAGGFIATLPYKKDYRSKEIGHYIDKYFAGDAKFKTEDRIRMARLLENMTGGTALAESMHGAGSPQAMRVMIQRETNWEQKKNFAKKLAKISD